MARPSEPSTGSAICARRSGSRTPCGPCATESPPSFSEISPHPVLTAALKQNLDGEGSVLAVLPSLQRGRPSLAALDASLGALYAAGCDPHWAGRYPIGDRGLDANLRVATRKDVAGRRQRGRGGAAPRPRPSTRSSDTAWRPGYAHLGLGAVDWRARDRVFPRPPLARRSLGLHLRHGGDGGGRRLADARDRGAGAVRHRASPGARFAARRDVSRPDAADPRARVDGGGARARRRTGQPVAHARDRERPARREPPRAPRSSRRPSPTASTPGRSLPRARGPWAFSTARPSRESNGSRAKASASSPA